MTELRELLFGDVPIEDWAGTSPDAPWIHFQDAEHAMARADVPAAEAALHAVLNTPGLESRQYLQAWSCLRQLDRDALTGLPEELYGVVLEVPLEKGVDTLAAYQDHTARYLNQGGGAIVWDTHETVMDGLIDAVLTAARPLTTAIGVWESSRPALTAGKSRISLLTAEGLHFRDGGFDELLQDPATGPVFATGAGLMAELIGRTGHH
ncbi:MAG TPA: hypothetical protein VGM70_08680 [Pseudolysinimonas sp.]|jgi:hypothetical protein